MKPILRTGLSLLLFLNLILLAAAQYHLLTEYKNVPPAIFAIGVGLPAAAYARLRLTRSEPAAAPAGDPIPAAQAKEASPQALPLILLRVPVIVLAPVLAHSTALMARAAPFALNYATLFLLWGASIFCLIAATLQPGELRERWRAIRQGYQAELRHWALIAALTVFALVVRITMLEDAPLIFSFDEGVFANESAQLAEGAFRASPFEPAWLSHPRIFFFIMALSIKLLGRTVVAARLPPAIIGALTVPAIYALGRELDNRRVGLVAAIFMTGFQLHVHFSRLALNNIVDPLFGVLAFAWLVRGLKSKRLSDFALSGVALGMSQYFYAGARLLPVIMIVYLVIVQVFDKDRLKGRWLHLVVLAAGMVLVTWPASWFHIVERYPLTTRLSATGLFQTGHFDTMREEMSVAEIFWDQSKRSWLALIHTHDESGFYGRVGPVMGRYAGVPLLLGMMYALFPALTSAPQPYRGKLLANRWLLLLWVAATITAGSVLLIDPPHFARYVLLTPAAALLVGIGVVETVEAFLPLTERAALWVMVGMGVALMAGDLSFYFDVYTHNPNSYAHDPNTMLGYAAARYLEKEAVGVPGLQVYYLTTTAMSLEGSSLVEYFAPGLIDYEVLPPDHKLLPGEELKHNTMLKIPGVNPSTEKLFIIAGWRRFELDEIMERFPGGELVEHRGEADRLLFLTYRVGPGGE